MFKFWIWENYYIIVLHQMFFSVFIIFLFIILVHLNLVFKKKKKKWYFRIRKIKFFDGYLTNLNNVYRERIIFLPWSVQRWFLGGGNHTKIVSTYRSVSLFVCAVVSPKGSVVSTLFFFFFLNSHILHLFHFLTYIFK